jgi:hypothetical protein
VDRNLVEKRSGTKIRSMEIERTTDRGSIEKRYENENRVRVYNPDSRDVERTTVRKDMKITKPERTSTLRTKDIPESNRRSNSVEQRSNGNGNRNTDVQQKETKRSDQSRVNGVENQQKRAPEIKRENKSFNKENTKPGTDTRKTISKEPVKKEVQKSRNEVQSKSNSSRSTGSDRSQTKSSDTKRSRR